MLLLLGAACAAALALALMQSGPAPADQDRASTSAAGRPSTYTLPGARVFPEGIARKRGSQRFFVGSTTDGTIFRGHLDSGALLPFAAPGADGRTTAVGMSADTEDRLFVAGGATGKVFVVDADNGATIRVLDTQPRGAATFLNDVAVDGDTAYVTDSMRPVIFRVLSDGGLPNEDADNANDVGEITPWLDLRGTAFRYRQGFNANGIVTANRGRLLIVVQTNTGRLFRIDTRTRRVSRIALRGGARVPNGDGLVLVGDTLYVIRNAQEQIAQITLSSTRRSGRIRRRITSGRLRFPTTAIRDGRRLLVVNSQFNRQNATPSLPFSVVAVRRP